MRGRVRRRVRAVWDEVDDVAHDENVDEVVDDVAHDDIDHGVVDGAEWNG